MEEVITDSGISGRIHVGCTDERIVATLIVTNNRDESWHTESSMGAWSRFGLIDEDGLSRFESMASTAAVTHWELPPGTSLVRTRESKTPEEAEELAERDGFSADVNLFAEQENSEFKEYNGEEDVYFAHHIDISEEKDTQFTISAEIKLMGFNNSFELSFTPEELSEPIDVENEVVRASEKGGGRRSYR